MRVLDRSGRLFGKVNIIDAVVVALVVLGIAAAYGASVLFRTPKPTIIRLEPSTLPVSSDTRWVRLTGTNLRPYYRAQFADASGDTAADYSYEPFSVQSPTAARVRVRDDLKPGVYDLLISDESKVLVRMPKALMVPHPPPPPAPPSVQADVKVRGAFVNMGPDEVAYLRGSGDGSGSDESWGRILTVGTPTADDVTVRAGTGPVPAMVAGRVRLPVVLLVRCDIVDTSCRVGGGAVSVGSVVKMKLRGRPYDFLVDEVYPATSVWADFKASGAFVGLNSSRTDALRRSATSAAEPWGRVLAIGSPETDDVNVKTRAGTVAAPVAGFQRVPAVLLVHCEIADGSCRIGGAGVSAGATVKVKAAGGVYDFVIHDLYSTATTPLKVTVEVGAAAPVLAVAQNEVALPPTIEQALGLVPRLLSVSNPSSRLLRTGVGPYAFDVPGTVFTAVVSVAAERINGEWQLAGKPIRVGESFTYAGRTVTMSGSIVGVDRVADGESAHGR